MQEQLLVGILMCWLKKALKTGNVGSDMFGTLL